MPTVTYRDLTTLDEFALVVDLERKIWGPGYDDVVPVPILAISLHRGGILIGAFDRDRMVGFVYSLPGILGGKPTQWSHMLGVVDEFRNEGVGYDLKLLQRERTMAMGLDLIEWTYDPMQAMNAHLNFTKLGVVAQEYGENVYGNSSSPLHQGNPTDRFTVQWWVREPHVERRISSRGTNGFSHAVSLRTHEVGEAVRVNRATGTAEWYECTDVNLNADARRLAVEIPMGFTAMLSRAPALALAWRMATRRIFTTYFTRGYRAVEFFLDRANRRGSYLLVRNEE
jgi:predicted GNAT superfamily acetyltransferase